jgi:hypothetical protein
LGLRRLKPQLSHYHAFARPGLTRVHGDPLILSALAGENGLTMSMYTDLARTYYLEAASPSDWNWTTVQTVPGSAAVQSFTDPNPPGARVYRIRVE